MLLNTPGGTVDLRTGKLRPHDSEDYMTKCTAVTPDATCPIPIFLKFLAWATAGDEDFQAYLKRAFGYTLTGSTVEEILFFLYGGGNNGKGVLMHLISWIIGDYQCAASTATIEATMHDQHPADLAALQGARLVTISETEEGRRWAESKIKMMTGRDAIPCRHMGGEWFNYEAQFKMWINGNHKPGLRSINKGIKRRIKLLPFKATIADDKVNTNLGEELKTEAPGILAWMIEGCLEWKRDGLKQPKVVTDATDQYLASEDVFSQWLETCCLVGKYETGEDRKDTIKNLFGSFKKYAQDMNEPEGTSRAFAQRLRDRGFEPAASIGDNKDKGFKGLAVKL